VRELPGELVTVIHLVGCIAAVPLGCAAVEVRVVRVDPGDVRFAAPVECVAAASTATIFTTNRSNILSAIPDAPVRASSSFAELGVPPFLTGAIEAMGITEPFPVQVAALPSALAGRDILGRARTGSGKTLAFAVPVVARLAASSNRAQPKQPRALVLVPTRELAAQVASAFVPLARAARLRVAAVYGGLPQRAQVAALMSGADILVACPGRLEDLIEQGYCRLGAVEVTVVDEADHMSDLGFLPAVRRLLDQTRTGTQRLLFSATLDQGVDVLVKRYLRDPVTCSVDVDTDANVETTHHLFAVRASDKAAIVHQLASGAQRSLLFTRTKRGASKLAGQLTQAGIRAVDLHGNLTQNARQRNLASFAAGTSKVLVATDIAARGIHVEDVALVVHVDPPEDHKAFVHRSGRTARAGAIGTVVTLVTPEQVADTRRLTRRAGVETPTVVVGPGDDRISAITGPAAPRSVPVPPSAPQTSVRSAGSRPTSQFGPRRSGGAASGRSRRRW
jgi:superfamily II DNA/RNA helicase